MGPVHRSGQSRRNGAAFRSADHCESECAGSTPGPGSLEADEKSAHQKPDEKSGQGNLIAGPLIYIAAVTQLMPHAPPGRASAARTTGYFRSPRPTLAPEAMPIRSGIRCYTFAPG